MKKLYLFMLTAGLSLSAVAQQKFELGKPNNDNYRYLDKYQALKEYIDRSKYPNFKLGVGTTVSDYLNNSLVRDLTNKNFDETVAGNAMKMSSCVDGNGNMNFTTVKNYVNAATKAGLNVYGHTLAWHSQQPNGWLRALLADKAAPELTDGDVEIVTVAASKDFRKTQSVGWKDEETKYGFKITFDATDGLHVNATKSCEYQVQFVGMSDLILTKGKTYKMTMTVKGSKAGNVTGRLGDWGTGAGINVPFTTEWKDVEINIKPTMVSNFMLLQLKNFIGDVYIKNITLESKTLGKTTTEEGRRCIKAHATARQSDVWDNQMWLVPGSFSSGASYVFTADVRADKPAYASTQIHKAPGSYVGDGIGNINFTTEWKTVVISGKFGNAGQSIALNLSEYADENNYYFDNVSLKIGGVEKMKNGDFEGTEVSTFKVKENSGNVVDPPISEGITYVFIPSTVPLSKQERHDTLVYAMDKWIKGMMNACGGKVKAWDLVNEALSGDGNDGEGNYLLQHSEGYNPNATWDVGGENFYWQDFMGDLEYVRQACRLARKYGPEDIVLFINDYNLESEWDDNKKLKSLINWIKKWESDGVTKIDGIGTQMHISCFENESILNNIKSHITKMFDLMAKSGKLVRVSEMDMAYVRGSNRWGQALQTSQLTEAEHKKMADFYEWIIKEYFRLVPPEQQWGICQWCGTDAPANSGWRKNEPVGIWDLNYYRKHAYAGFVRGLNGGEPTGIDNIEADKKVDTSNGIYNLNGMRMPTTSLDELPSGLYIVNGKKVVK